MVRRRASRAPRLVVVLLVTAAVAWLATASFQDGAPGSVRAAVRDYLALRRVEQHADVLRSAAAESGVDPYLLAALMVAESSGRVGARSSKGALGLFQLMPVTARWRAEKLGLEPPSEEALLSDPLLNARLGADNLAWLLDTYDGNVERALIAYNVGTGALAKQVRTAGSWEAWLAERRGAGDSELLAYADRVLRYRESFRERRLFGQ